VPTYQYACLNGDCGNQFELVQSFSDPAASECPVCGQRVRKVFGSVGVVFKGSGFYRTDSRKSEKATTPAESSTPSTSTSTSSSTGSGDSSAASTTSSSSTPAGATSGGSSSAA
jgi:putative FmdB family regulatory protein